MTNDLTKKKQADGPVAYYDNGRSGFANFAAECDSGIIGQLLRCSKGDWSFGQDRNPPPEGFYLALMDSMSHGWGKWGNNTLVDSRLFPVMSNAIVPHRYTLGDLDESQWETDPDGKPRDPWQEDYRMVLISVSQPSERFTFSSSAYGAKLAFRELCRAYEDGVHQHEGQMPVVALATGQRKSHRYGFIKQPEFPVQGWASVDDVMNGRKGQSGKKAVPAEPKPKPKPPQFIATADMEAALDDEIPDWGQKQKASS